MRRRRGEHASPPARDPFVEHAEDAIRSLVRHTQRLLAEQPIDVAAVLEFVNATRAVRDRPALDALPWKGAAPGSQSCCVLARAFDADVVTKSEDPRRLALRLDWP